MKVLLLYLVTAIATGAQVFWLLMWAIWGAPTSATQYIALLGSVILLAAALLHRTWTKIASILAGLGIAALWCFYLPAVVYTFIRFPYRDVVSQPSFLSSLLLSLLVTWTPVALLAVSTVCAVKNVKRRMVLLESEK